MKSKKTRRTIWLLCGTLLVCSALAAQEQDPRLEGFEAFVEGVMNEWKVPGLGVAILEDGELVLAKGYGWRDVEGQLPVTEDTLFAIGSNSKSFTATLLAMQVEEGLVAWDLPIRSVLPEFQLHDPIATQEMTIADLLSHRSGLPRHDLYWLAARRTREELMAGLRHLEPTASFRSRFQYQNLMFLTAGVVSERIGNKTWEELVAERIFGPLGMDRANFSVEAMQRDQDFSYGYTATDEVERVPFRDITAIGPAGSINTSVRELARYVQFHIDLGEIAGEALLSRTTARLLQQPQMVITGPLAARIQDGPEIGHVAYGYGLMVSSYRGEKHVRHGGGIDGFISAMEWLPERRIGAIALSNTSDNGTVPQLVVRQIFDRMLSLEPIDWAARAREADAQAEKTATEARQADLAAAHRETTPSHPLVDYAGDYDHPGYGPATVRLDGETLTVEVVGIEFPLEHYHYDVFSVPYDLPGSGLASGFGGLKVRFEYDVSGAISSLAIPLEPTLAPIPFERRPADSTVSP